MDTQGGSATATNNEYIFRARKNISRIIYFGLGDGLFDGFNCSDFGMY
jgi:hypothetical protein